MDVVASTRAEPALEMAFSTARRAADDLGSTWARPPDGSAERRGESPSPEWLHPVRADSARNTATGRIPRRKMPSFMRSPLVRCVIFTLTPARGFGTYLP